jgi:hypothetical protein
MSSLERRRVDANYIWLMVSSMTRVPTMATDTVHIPFPIPAEAAVVVM